MLKLPFTTTFILFSTICQIMKPFEVIFLHLYLYLVWWLSQNCNSQNSGLSIGTYKDLYILGVFFGGHGLFFHEAVHSGMEFCSIDFSRHYNQT